MNLPELFEATDSSFPVSDLGIAGVVRDRRSHPDFGETVRDSCQEDGLDVVFNRRTVYAGERITLRLNGGYRLQAVAAGGWFLSVASGVSPRYWIPVPPKVRTLDADAHLLTEHAMTISGFEVANDELCVHLQADAAGMLDLVIVRESGGCSSMSGEISSLCPLEKQQYFLYASHGIYEQPVDLFRHLVHGHIYNGEIAWPTQWRIPDELEAYALYLILSGLETATGKRLYSFLKRLVLVAIIDRQSEDGSWCHGEWTDRMECHVRLHTGGVLLLATALEEAEDPRVREAMGKAVEFSATLTDQTDIGTWFLHDSLETSDTTMNLSPFPWVRNRVFRKSPTNMLVLNTHLDTLIALDRYRRLTGDTRFDKLIESGRKAGSELLARRPLDLVYWLIYRLIDLTWHAPAEARQMPLIKRAMKRITWKYLIPRVQHFRARFPRLVMPTGYIDRAINLRGVSHAYQTVNIWDLVRYRRRFGSDGIESIIDEALRYTRESGLLGFWASLGSKGHALGFWVEALVHLCMASPQADYRRWLAEAMLASYEAGFGLAPAVLGANAEAVPVSQRMPCPLPTDDKLLIANLGANGFDELVLVNPTNKPAELIWQGRTPTVDEWFDANGRIDEDPVAVPAGKWLWARTVVDNT